MGIIKDKKKYKDLFLQALEKTLGNKTEACKIMKCSRTTLWNIMNKDPKFKKAVEDVEEAAIDFLESKFYENVDNNDTACIIFGLKTKGSRRGWKEHKDDPNEGQEYRPPNITISF